tara:strand:- start:3 stop:3848 length:3846 start_codon:yes stop_codon:yes gene_type:complete
MRKIVLVLFLAILVPNTWQNINSSTPKPMEVELISSDINTTKIKFTMDGFHLIPSEDPKLISYKVKSENGASILEKGAPDLHNISKSIIIPDKSKMSVNIVSYKYHDYEDVHIIPSKGNLSRDINPNDIPVTYGNAYKKDEFFPSSISDLGDPYILRDLRGQTISINPFQYNPVQKLLRVYSEVIVEFIAEGQSNNNTIQRVDSNIKLSSNYDEIYKTHFINYNNDTRFNYLVDQGNMLIISNDAFLSYMQPLVDWKNKKGIPTKMVATSETGTSSTQISNYIRDYYYSDGLTFVLLVGDYAQVTSPMVSGSASDPTYGFIEGNDVYAEVIIGRFSGSTPSHIQTQVQRTLEYENRDSGDYFNNAAGFASNQGPGYGGMDDDEFNDFLWNTVLSLFTYDDYYYEYDGSGGSDQGGINTINNGVGIINYTGHGSISSWGNGASLNTSQINQLTNVDKLPFVITVGCNVGEFNSTNECFSEAWQRATHNGQPAGGIAHFGSTISQSWEPPMHGQWAMNKILTESFNGVNGQPPQGHKTRSIGGILINGCLHMNDAQGNGGQTETKYWTLFGDPSLMIRTDEPSNMNIVHDDVVLVGQSQFIINTGLAGSLAALSLDGELLASGYANQFGAITLDLSDATATPGVFDLVITGFNAVTYETEITVLAPEGPYVTMDSFTGEVMHGMENSISIDIENVGSDPADQLIITLSTEDEHVTMIDYTETVSLDAGESMTVNGFSADISANIPNGHQIEFSVNLVSGNDSWDYSFMSTAMAPEINLLSFSGDLQPGSTTSVVVTMVNEGDATLMYPMLDLEVGPYLSASNIAFSGSDYAWPHEQADNIQTLTADISVSPSAPMGSIGELTVMVNQLNSDYNHQINIDVPIGQVTADFESGLDLEWTNGSLSPWNVTDEDANTGLNSFKSGQIGNNQTSSVSVTLDVTQEGDIEFYYRVSAEYSPSGNYFYDGLLFSINGQQVGQFQTESDGSSPWKVARYTVAPGITEFTWTYTKDSGGGSTDCINTDCLDAAFIDDIIFPPVYVESDYIVGDTNNDMVVNVLDVIVMVNMILGNADSNLETADLNSDGLINILDVTLLLNMILGDGRLFDANEAMMYISSDGVDISADGHIGAVQLTLSHGLNFELELTQDALVSDYKTDGTTTTLIVVAPETDHIFKTSDNFEVDEALVVNSNKFIDVVKYTPEFKLSAAYPNPFNPTTTIDFSVAKAGYASVTVYNLMGQVVGVLMDGIVDADTYNLTWNAQHLSSGVYMIKAESNGQVATQKIMLLK